MLGNPSGATCVLLCRALATNGCLRAPEPQSHWVIRRHGLSAGLLMPQPQGGQQARAHTEDTEAQWPRARGLALLHDLVCSLSLPNCKMGTQLSSHHDACGKIQLQAHTELFVLQYTKPWFLVPTAFPEPCLGPAPSRDSLFFF